MNGKLCSEYGDVVESDEDCDEGLSKCQRWRYHGVLEKCPLRPRVLLFGVLGAQRALTRGDVRFLALDLQNSSRSLALSSDPWCLSSSCGGGGDAITTSQCAAAARKEERHRRRARHPPKCRL